MPSITGSVTMASVQVGSVSGDYTDESTNGSSENIVTRNISITVTDNKGNDIGNGTLSYDDYVTYGSGGSRTIDISGEVDMGPDNVGSASGSLDDQYGAVGKVDTELTLTIQEVT